MSIKSGYPNERLYIEDFNAWYGIKIKSDHNFHVYYGDEVKESFIDILFTLRHLIDEVHTGSDVNSAVATAQDRFRSQYSEYVRPTLKFDYSVSYPDVRYAVYVYVDKGDGEIHLDFRAIPEDDFYPDSSDEYAGNNVVFYFSHDAYLGSYARGIMPSLFKQYGDTPKKERCGENSSALFKVVHILEQASNCYLESSRDYDDLVHWCNRNHELSHFTTLAYCVMEELLAIEHGRYTTLGIESIDFGSTKLQRLALDLVCLLVNNGGHVHMATDSEYVLSLLNLYIRSSKIEIEQPGIYRSIVETYKRIKVEDIDGENFTYFDLSSGSKPGFFVDGVFAISNDFTWIQTANADLDRMEEFNSRYKLP